MGQRDKRPKPGILAAYVKKPRVPKFSELDGIIQFSFGWFDGTSRWLLSPDGECANMWHIGEHLKHYEGMTWASLAADKSRDHPIELEKLRSEVKTALTNIKMDEFDLLWSLSLSGTERVWGVRVSNHFMVLWWDPQHQVYQVEKKHT